MPGRRRSLRGIDLERLLLKPLSGAGKLLVAGSGGGGDSASSSSSSPGGEKEKAPVSFPPKRLTLELELELIDAEREILLRLVRFFQMMGEYRVALDYARKALLMMESMPRAFFGVVEVSSMLIEMALLEQLF